MPEPLAADEHDDPATSVSTIMTRCARAARSYCRDRSRQRSANACHSRGPASLLFPSIRSLPKADRGIAHLAAKAGAAPVIAQKPCSRRSRSPGAVVLKRCGTVASGDGTMLKACPCFRSGLSRQSTCPTCSTTTRRSIRVHRAAHGRLQIRGRTSGWVDEGVTELLIRQ